MPDFPTNSAPRLTQHLVSQRAFEAEPLCVVDAGAFGGVESHWTHFGDQVRVIAFEPNAEECARLNARASGVRYVPCALGSQEGPASLHLYAFPPANSLHQANLDYWNRRVNREMYRKIGEVPVSVKRLDDVLADYGLPYVDFIKLDVEGSELDVLSGATLTLANPSTFGIVFEFVTSRKAFLPEAGRKFGTLFDIHAVLDKAEFELFDISTYRYARAALPQPFSYRYTDSKGELYAGTSIRGQKTNGDALYCRDLVRGREKRVPSITHILKGACILELFGLEDCAVELLWHYREALETRYDAAHLVELLVPKVRGKSMSYQQYLSTYETRRSFFMPAPGFRFPDHTTHSFDGVFVERTPYRPKDATRPLVTLAAATFAKVWSLATPATRASPGADGIHLMSDCSHYSYQLVSAIASVSPQGDYVLAYDITVLNGGVTVGVVDGETGQWADQVSLPQGSNVGRVYVSTPGANARIVVANCNVAAPMESESRLRRLELFEAEYADA
jgi:FkbM family methyltransferase